MSFKYYKSAYKLEISISFKMHACPLVLTIESEYQFLTFIGSNFLQASSMKLKKVVI